MMKSRNTKISRTLIVTAFSIYTITQNLSSIKKCSGNDYWTKLKSHLHTSVLLFVKSIYFKANKNTTSTSTSYILEQVVCQVNLNTLELVSLSLQESESIPQSSLNLHCGHRQNLNCRRAAGANTGLNKPWTPCYLFHRMLVWSLHC